MDKKLEEKLKTLADKGNQVEAIRQSIADKQEMEKNVLDSLKHLQGMPAAQTAAEALLKTLQDEIAAENKTLDSIVDLILPTDAQQ